MAARRRRISSRHPATRLSSSGSLPSSLTRRLRNAGGSGRYPIASENGSAGSRAARAVGAITNRSWRLWSCAVAGRLFVRCYLWRRLCSGDYRGDTALAVRRSRGAVSSHSYLSILWGRQPAVFTSAVSLSSEFKPL